MSSNHTGNEQGAEHELTAVEVAENAGEPRGGAGEEMPSAVVPTEATSGVHADAASSPAEPPDASRDEGLRALGERTEQLARGIEEANRLSQERERIIDRLHQENQQLRQGELQQAMLPVFRDLVRLHDDLRQTALGHSTRADLTPQGVASDFRCFAEIVSDILYRHGVERYEAREGDPFNPKEHRVLGAVPTPEQSRDRTVARSVRDGFRSEARVVRLLEAEVYRYVPAAPEGDEGVGGAPSPDSTQRP